MNTLTLTFVCVLFWWGSVISKKLPSYITPCHRNDPELFQCTLKEVEKLRPRLKDGIPEMQIPSTNPLRITEATLGDGVNFKVKFTDIKVYNADSFQFTSLVTNFSHFEFTMTVPSIRLLANYSVEGNILLLKLNSHGPADGNFTDINVKIIIDGTPYTKRGKEYLKIVKEDLDVELGRPPILKFDNIFPDEELTQRTNVLLNENVPSLVKEIKPFLNETLLKMLRTFFSKILTRYSIDDLFPK